MFDLSVWQSPMSCRVNKPHALAISLFRVSTETEGTDGNKSSEIVPTVSQRKNAATH